MRFTAKDITGIRGDHGHSKITISSEKQNKYPMDFYFMRSYSNCKLGMLDHISNLFYLEDENEINETIASIFNYIPNQIEVVLITTNNETNLDYIEKYFDVLSVLTLPIGYRGGYQYHIYVRNNNKYDTFTEKYTKRIKEEGIKFYSPYNTKENEKNTNDIIVVNDDNDIQPGIAPIP